MRGFIWQIRPVPEIVTKSLTSSLNIGHPAASILVNRGITTPEEARLFLNPRLADLRDPFLMDDLGKSASRIARAITQKEKVFIHGDYDVDGITATALLILFFRRLGHDAGYFIPERMADGYGVSAERLRDMAGSGAKLIITVDCGIKSAAEFREIEGSGIDAIVVDHHQPEGALPEVFGVINPLKPRCGFPFKYMSAAGLTFYLIIGIRNILRQEGFFSGEIPEPDIRELLDIAAIGTIGDLVPLVCENRVMAAAGIAQMRNNPRPGIAALLEVSGGKKETVSSETVSFQIVPRLNACGRLSTAVKAVELLIAGDYGAAKETAAILDGENRERQSIEKRIFEEAKAMFEGELSKGERYAAVLMNEGWHQGVVGIVASRLVEAFHRPAVVLASDGEKCVGSCRSIENFNMVEGLALCKDLLERYGGHYRAAGLTVTRDNFYAFKERFHSAARDRLKDEDLRETLLIDSEIGFEELSADFLGEIERLSPFGEGNPEPVFATYKARVIEKRQTRNDGKHLLLIVEKNGVRCNAIGFRMGNLMDGIGVEIDVAYTPMIDEYRGIRSLKLNLHDLKQG